MKKEYLLAVVAGILFGFIVFGGQVLANFGLSAFEVSTIPFAISGLVLLPIILLKKEMRLKRSNFWLMILYGFVGTGTVIGQYTSLYFGIPVAMVLLLLYAQPLWTSLICHFGLKEKISKREIAACAIVLLGLVVLLNPFVNTGHYNLIGLLLALFGGISLSGWIVVGSLLSKRGNHPIGSQCYQVIISVIFLLLLLPLFNLIKLPGNLIRFNFDFTFNIWIYLIVYGTLIISMGQIIYLYAVKKVSTVDAGIMMLLEPITGSLLAVIFLSQPLTANVIIGGLFILLANYLVITKK